MSQAELKLHFRNAGTLRELERLADSLGLSPDELAEVAIEHELIAEGIGLEQKLLRTLDRLKTYSHADRERDIDAFAQSEVGFKEPLRARREEAQDAYDIGALFARPVERG